MIRLVIEFMCGISIIVNQKDHPVPEFQVKAMNDKVIHRGPDDEGYFFGSNFAFGHRRLSIIDTSSAGHQPMLRDKDCIVYNGMLYNYLELRDELIAVGYTFRSQTDTEVILAAYQRWGTDAFKKFNGMWAFAIYDDAHQSLILCRDHFGIKPMYYTGVGDCFLAGSEIKQFTAVVEFKPVMNQSVAINFLTQGWLNYSAETFFKGVSSLNAGHYLVYDLRTHSTKITEWYNLEKEVKRVQATEEEALVMVKSLFDSSVKLRMRSDVQVGSCLSGGIDSSSIVSLIYSKQIANANFTTFTSCYPNKKYDEQEFSDIVTRQTGFRAVKVFPELQNLFSRGHLDTMIYHQDQPVNSASHYSEFQVFKAARENNMTVMLDGQGSDEYLCGYPEFFSTYIRELLHQTRFASALKSIKVKGSHGAGTVTVLKDIINTLYAYPFIRSIKAMIAKPEFRWMNKEQLPFVKKYLRQYNAENIYELSIQQLLYTSIPYQLHSEDRNSMIFSIESRLPFLDHRLVEYIVGLPSALKINKGYSKYIFRRALTELPESIRWRKDKMGFVAPEKEWVLENHRMIRQELEGAVKGTPFFSEELLSRFDRFIQGQLGYEQIYFRALTLYRFCRIFDMKLEKAA